MGWSVGVVRAISGIPTSTWGVLCWFEFDVFFLIFQYIFDSGYVSPCK